MKHLLAALHTDIVMLYRTGYAQAVAVVFALLLILLLQISTLDFAGFADLIAAIILVDQTVSCLMLTGLMILLERGEGVVTALATTPMSRAAYIASKTIAVGSICAIQTILLALIAYDGNLSIGFLFGGLLAMAAILTLFAFVAVAPFDTLFRFLLPMIGWAFFLALPAYGTLFGWRPLLMEAHPMSPPMTLLEAAFTELPSSRVLYAISGTMVWITIAGLSAFAALGMIRARAAGG